MLFFLKAVSAKVHLSQNFKFKLNSTSRKFIFFQMYHTHGHALASSSKVDWFSRSAGVNLGQEVKVLRHPIFGTLLSPSLIVISHHSLQSFILLSKIYVEYFFDILKHGFDYTFFL